jgi:hypothetical protein
MRVLRVIFAVVGSIAALLALATVVLAVVFYTPGASSRAVAGSTLYAGIAVACFYAVFRMRPAPVRRGFDVIERSDIAGR